MTPETIRTAKKVMAEWNTFRKNCRLAGFGGRKQKAWRVPGTPEAGEDAMYFAEYNRRLRIEERSSPSPKRGQPPSTR